MHFSLNVCTSISYTPYTIQFKTYKFSIMFDNHTIIFDIIILTEAGLGLHNQFQIPNYTMFKITNYINQNYGIIAFINNSIINTQVTDLITHFMSIV